LNACESCHNPGMYDFSAPWYTDDNLSRRLVQTVATGTYDAVTLTADGGLPALAISVSPYVVADGGVNYYFANDVRGTVNYGRQFIAGRNANLWTVGMTYRFVMSAWPGGGAL